MSHLTWIDDPTDERLADYAALTDAALRKRYERRRGVLIAEGPHPVRELVASRYPVRSLLLAEERLEALVDVTSQVDAPVYVVPREVLYEVVRFKLHQGVIGCGWRLPPTPAEQLLDRASRIAVLEGLNDHENLGTLFRSARGLGVDGVVLGPGCADPLYRRSVRVSMGHVLHVPHAYTTDLAAAMTAMRRAGVRMLALTPAADAVPLRDVEVAADERVAVVLGAEGPGLTGAVQAQADERVRIPMHDGVDSLNVATAAAIAFHAVGAS